MARPSRKERRPASLQCNKCGHQFEGRTWFESVGGLESTARGTTDWVSAKAGARGSRCPRCGSRDVGLS